MRVLIVGAGVIGQVYGFHLAQSGAEVCFLVKDKHAASARKGFTLYPLNRGRKERTTPVRWADYHVLTATSEVARQHFDQVYLTVSSTALRSGEWFARLVPAIGEATVVMLQPGPEDRAFIMRSLPASRLVQGTITVIGYVAPLPGETRFAEPGVAYWFPPLSPCPLMGPTARLDDVLDALRRGNLPAKRDPEVADYIFVEATFMPLLAVLEESGWSLRELRRKDRLQRAQVAGQEALAAVARDRDRRRPVLYQLALTSLPLRAALGLAPALFPFDLETYLRVHFTKVGDQTRDFLRYFMELARKQGTPTPALASLPAT